MTTHDVKKTDASAVITAFLETRPNPSANDWRVLIERNPELVREIVDASLLHSQMTHLEDGDEEEALDKDAYGRSVSRAMSVLYGSPSMSIDAAWTKVVSVRGPAVRVLAAQVGLNSHVALLSGVLAGSIRAPRVLLDRLANVFETTSLCLRECFDRAFESRTLPAHKAENGKPALTSSPVAWSDAVRSLALPRDAMNELLGMDE